MVLPRVARCLERERHRGDHRRGESDDADADEDVVGVGNNLVGCGDPLRDAARRIDAKVVAEPGGRRGEGDPGPQHGDQRLA